MGFDAGSISAELRVSRDQFKRDLDAAKADAEKFAAGKYEATLKAKADTADADAKLGKTKAKADDLGTKTPTVKVKADTGRANAELDRTRAKADSLGKSFATGLSKPPWWAGPALAGLPAAVNLLGVAAGASAALGASFAAGGIALASYGAVAKGVLGDAATASKAVTKAQETYNAAIASGTKRSVAYKAEQAAIEKAYSGMSPAQLALSKQTGALARSWEALGKAETTAVAASVTPWLRGLTTGMKYLGPVTGSVAVVIGDLGRQFASLTGGPSFRTFMQFIGTEGAQTVGAGGSAILDFLHGFMIILPELTPLVDDVNRGVSNLGASFLTWAESDRSRAEIQSFLGWLRTNGPGVGLLVKNIAGALVNLGAGLGAGGGAEIRLLSGFFGLIARLPRSFVAPVTDLAAALLLISKFGFGRKILTVAVNWAGQAGALLVKWLTGGALDLTGKFGAGAGMQRAADTMVAASAGMQRAADTMVGADAAGGGAGRVGRVAGAGGAAGAGGGALAALGPAALAIIAAVVAKTIIESQIGPQKSRAVGDAGLGRTADLANNPAFAVFATKTLPRWLGGVTSFVDRATGLLTGHRPRGGKAAAPKPDGGPGGYEDYTIRDTGGPPVPKLDAAQYANLKQIAAMYGITLPAAYKLTQSATFSLGQSERDQSKAAQDANMRLSASAAVLKLMPGHTAKATRAMDAYTASYRLNGAVSSTTHAARQRLISDLENAGLTAKQARDLVGKLTVGIAHSSSVYASTAPARKRLADDLTAFGFNSYVAKGDVDKLTTSVINTGRKSDQTQSARTQLIKDFEFAGASSRAATRLVDAFIRKLGQVKSPAPVRIQVSAEGQWHISSGQKTGPGGFPVPATGARGMLVPGYGGGDTVPAWLTPGEAVVPAHLVPAVAPFLRANDVPGFAAGGVAGSYRGSLPGEERWQGREAAATMKAVESAAAAAAVAGLKAMAGAGGGGGFGVPGPGGGAPGANAALAQLMYGSVMRPGDWPAWNYVEMREAGWNQFARNPSSGAYGIPQALPPSKMGPAANPPQSNPGAQISWMWNYMRGRYGGPQGAAAHERAFNWYDGGGWLPPGGSLAFNATRRREAVLTPDQSEAFVAMAGDSGLTALAGLLGELIDAVHQNAGDTADGIAAALGGAGNRAAYRAQYSARS